MYRVRQTGMKGVHEIPLRPARGGERLLPLVIKTIYHELSVRPFLPPPPTLNNPDSCVGLREFHNETVVVAVFTTATAHLF